MPRQGDRDRSPCPGLPFLCIPPFWAPGSTLSSHPPLLIQPVPPGLCRGLAILRALPPTPTRRGGQRETHSSLCHFPSWAAKGPRRQPPTPSLFAHLCLFSFPPRPPLCEPHPPAPLMLCRWEQGSPGAPAPLSAFLRLSHSRPSLQGSLHRDKHSSLKRGPGVTKMVSWSEFSRGWASPGIPGLGAQAKGCFQD